MYISIKMSAESVGEWDIACNVERELCSSRDRGDGIWERIEIQSETKAYGIQTYIT